MPIDINAIRANRGGNPEDVRKSQKARFKSVDLVDQVIALDEEWRAKQASYDTLKMDMNSLQQDIKKLLKEKKDAKEIIAKRKEMAINEPVLKKEIEELKLRVDKELAKIANSVDPTVPISQNEDDNVIVSTWGTIRKEENLKFHHDLLHRVDGYEPDRGVQVAGHKGYFLKAEMLSLD